MVGEMRNTLVQSLLSRRAVENGFGRGDLFASTARLVFGAALCCMVSVCPFGIAAEEKAKSNSASPVLRIGFTPGEESEGLSLRSAEFGQLVEKKLEASGTKVRVQTQVGRTYSDLVDQLKNKKVDFAFLNALSFVRAEESLPLKVLLKKVWENPFYYSVLLTPRRSPFKNLQSLHKARIAFVSEGSGSGHLYPLMALRAVNLDLGTFKPDQIRFSGAHDRSVDLLKRGEVDVIAIFSNTKTAEDSAWTRHGGRVGDVRVLWASEPIPNDPFVVRKDYYDRNPRMVHELMLALIELSESESDRPALKRILGVKSLMWATAQQYDSVRRISTLSKEFRTEVIDEAGEAK